MQYSSKKPVFDETGKYKFSKELRELADQDDTMGVYRIYLDGEPMYIGIAKMQPMYKTITRHFQRHNDNFQGRWVGRQSEGLWQFDYAWGDTPEEILTEEAKQVLTKRPKGNVEFNTGNLRGGRDKGKFFDFAEPLQQVLEFETDGQEQLDLSKPIPEGQFKTLYTRIKDLDSYKEYLENQEREAKEQARQKEELERELRRELQEIEARDRGIK